MSDRSLEERIRLRLLTEGDPQVEDIDGLTPFPLWAPDEGEGPTWVQPSTAARIAALEVEDSSPYAWFRRRHVTGIKGAK